MKAFRLTPALDATSVLKLKLIRERFDLILPDSTSEEEWALHYYFDAGWDAAKKGVRVSTLSPYSDEGFAFQLGFWSRKFHRSIHSTDLNPIMWTDGVYGDRHETIRLA